MKIYLIIFLFVITSQLKSQVVKRDSTYLNFSFGLNEGITYIAYDDIQTNKSISFFYLYIEPKFTFYLYKNIGLGISYGQQFLKSNIYSKTPFRQLGIHGKYILPFVLNKPFFKRIHVFLEFQYYKTNFIITEDIIKTNTYGKYTWNENFIMSKDLNQNLFCIPIGFQMNPWKGLQINCYCTYDIFINGKKSISPKISFEYQF